MHKILVVDDQYGIRVLLNEVFQSAGYVVHTAENGFVGLDLFEQHKHDLVLLDMKMPGMDGLDILTKVRATDKITPVFMMTAYGELDLVIQADRLGANKHFTKPFDVDELVVAVNEIFKSKFS